jgi:sec-independent protein translocase protein TatA
MFNSLFDSPWKILIVAVVILVLFGSRKLPEAARSLGKSMRILKSEVQGLHDDDVPAAIATSARPAPPAQVEGGQVRPSDAQSQIEELQRKLDNLKDNLT